MWRLYSDDGTVFIGPTVSVEKRTGVIAIAETDPDHNWIFWFGKDWYLLQNGGHWMGVDQAGMIDQVVTRIEEIQCVCQGRTIVPHSDYQAIIDRMLADCQPSKTGWHPDEKP